MPEISCIASEVDDLRPFWMGPISIQAFQPLAAPAESLQLTREAGLDVGAGRVLCFSRGRTITNRGETTMEIRLKGGPYDNAVFATGGRDITFTVTEVAFSDDPDAIDLERYRYVETRETDDAGRRIFEYKPRAVSKSVVTNVAVQSDVGRTQAAG